MPKLIVKVPNGQLEDVVTKLINNAISFSILFDEAEQAGMQVTKQETVNLVKAPATRNIAAHPNGKQGKPAREQALGSKIYDYLDTVKSATTEEIAEYIFSLNIGWKKSSVSSALSYLHKDGDVSRIAKGRSYVYSRNYKADQLDLSL